MAFPGIPWILVHAGVDTTATSKRKDIREMLIQLAPLHAARVTLGPNQWHAVMAVGAGLAKLSASRRTDELTIISGILSDHPPLLCEFNMTHSSDDDSVFHMNTLALLKAPRN